MATKSRRFLGYVPRFVGRVWNDIAPSLQDYLERLRDSLTNGIPGGVTDRVPTPVSPDNVADIGTENAGWSPGDHIHDAPTGAPVALGASAAEGSANTLSRSDHVHPRSVEVDGQVGDEIEFVDSATVDFTTTLVGDVLEVTADATGGDTWKEVVAFPLITPPHAEDDEFRDGVVDSDFDQMDGAGAPTPVWTEDGDVISVSVDVGDAGGELHGLVKDIAGLAAGDYVETAVRVAGGAGADMGGGICFNDNDHVWGSTGVQVVGMLVWDRTSSFWMFLLGEWTGLATVPGATAFSASMAIQSPWVHLRLVYVASNSFRLDWSTDGVSWIEAIPATAITLTPTGAGMVVGSPGVVLTTPMLAAFEYFRVVS